MLKEIRNLLERYESKDVALKLTREIYDDELDSDTLIEKSTKLLEYAEAENDPLYWKIAKVFLAKGIIEKASVKDISAVQKALDHLEQVYLRIDGNEDGGRLWREVREQLATALANVSIEQGPRNVERAIWIRNELRGKLSDRDDVHRYWNAVQLAQLYSTRAIGDSVSNNIFAVDMYSEAINEEMKIFDGDAMDLPESMRRNRAHTLVQMAKAALEALRGLASQQAETIATPNQDPKSTNLLRNKAEGALMTALTLFEGLNDHYRSSECHYLTAILHILSDNDDKWLTAESILRKAIETTNKRGELNSISFLAHSTLTRCLINLNDHRTALQVFRETFRIFEAMRTKMNDLETLQRWIELGEESFASLAAFHLKQSNMHKSLLALEFGRSRLFASKAGILNGTHATSITEYDSLFTENHPDKPEPLFEGIPAGTTLVMPLMNVDQEGVFIIRGGKITPAELDFLVIPRMHVEISTLLFGDGFESFLENSSASEDQPMDASKKRVREFSRQLRNGVMTADSDTSQTREVFAASIDRAIHRLHGFFIEPLLDRFSDLEIPKSEKIVFILNDSMMRLPFHAATHDVTGSVLLDSHSVSYAPSITAFVETCRAAQPISSGMSILSVSDPRDNLPLAGPESALFSLHFKGDENSVLEGEQATLAGVRRMSATADVIHFATHGRHYPWAVSESALELAGSEKLSVGELLNQFNLSNCALVVLSACESGLFGDNKPSAEPLSLPVACMLAGCSSVVASKWPVEDMATMLLMTNFVHGLTERKLSPADALREAQVWLRGASYADIIDLLPPLIDRLDGSQEAKLMALYNRLSQKMVNNAEQKPFSEPIYWAAFFVMGN